MAVPATVIYFTCYDQLRDFLRFGLGLQGSHVPLVAGGLARCKCMKELQHRRPGCVVPTVLLKRNASLCCSGGCDGDQPSGAGQDQDAVLSAVLQRAADVYPLCCGPGWTAVPVEGLGTHCSQRRALLRLEHTVLIMEKRVQCSTETRLTTHAAHVLNSLLFIKTWPFCVVLPSLKHF